MVIRKKIRDYLVNTDAGIKRRYLEYRETYPDNKKNAIAFLLLLNAKKYLLKSNIEYGSLSDRGTKIKYVSESKLFAKKIDPLIQKIEETDVVSFDVFDTLVLRCVSKPEDVFFLLQKKLGYPGLKRIRVEEERKARLEKEKEHGSCEVNINEIWERIELRTGISAGVGVECEWESELECCYANPFFKHLIDNDCLTNKTIILTTDTYWDEEKIKSLLDNCHFPKFDYVFASCQYSKSKANGDLYCVIKRMFKGKKILHIGDNQVSDVKNARLNDFDTYYYPNTQNEGKRFRTHDMSTMIASAYSGIVNGYLHNGLISESREFELGFVYGGLFVFGFCQFINKLSESKGVDKILFLARDGDVLKKSYEFIFPERKAVCEYVYWSRLAGIKACANEFKSMYIDRMIKHKVNQGYSIGDCFKTMDLTHLLPILSNETALSPEESLSKNNSNTIVDFIEKHWDTIVENYEKQSKAAKEYISASIGDAKSVLVVDIGWAGSSFYMVKDIVNRSGLNCKVFGALSGTVGGMQPESDDSIISLYEDAVSSYIFSPLQNRDIWKKHDVSKDHNLVMELMLSSSQPSLRSFYSESSHCMEFNKKSEYMNSDRIQTGIMKFIELFSKHPFGGLHIPGSDAYAPIALIYQNEKMIDTIIESVNIRGNIE